MATKKPARPAAKKSAEARRSHRVASRRTTAETTSTTRAPSPWAAGARVGFVRPITLLPFPSEIVARAASGARTVAVYENSQGQMVDDVRLALEGAVPVQFIGRLSLDSSGFGIAPDLDGDYLRDRLLEVLNG